MIENSSGIEEGFSDLPYPGLRPFVREEADIFFGRNEQVYSLLNKLEKNRFLAVVGSSGCGKSSLIRAGLVPALDAGIMASAGSTWSIATMKPGGRPIQNLASALLESTLVGEEWRRYPDATAAVSSILRRGSRGIIELLRELRTSTDHRYLIVVDQFEEIFRFHKYGNANEAIAFVDLLLEASRQNERPIFVTLSMRSDFLGDCSLFNGLPEAINNGQFLVPRLTREQCREAVIGPAVAFGGMVEDALVTRILNDMQGDSDQLPLMQHALLQMWEMASAAQDRSEDEIGLKLEHYEKIGGMDGSLSNHLEQVLGELLPADVPTARKIFCRLTERSSSLRDTRRPAPLKELAEAADVATEQIERVIRPFRLRGRSFLVPGLSVRLSDESIIDISHEALIRKWARLSEWVDEESSAARIYQRLVETAELWEADKAALWGTPDLENAIAWRETFSPNAAWASRYGGNFALAMRFLDESQRAAQEQERLALERQQRELTLSQEVARAEKQRADEAEQSRARQAQANRRLRGLLFVAGTVSILAITALVWAIWSKLENTALKESQEQIVQANDMLEIANQEAMLAKQEALKTRDELQQSFEELQRSREQLLDSSQKELEAKTQQERARAEALLSKQAEERAQEESKKLRLAQGKANFQLANIRWDQGRVKEAVELLDSVPSEARFYEWGLCNRLFQGSYLTIYPARGARAEDIGFMPDGKTLAVLLSAGVVEFYDGMTGKKVRTIQLKAKANSSDMDLSPDGKWLAVSTDVPHELSIVDLESEEQVAVLDLQGCNPYNLEFSPDRMLLKVNGWVDVIRADGGRSSEDVLQIWGTSDWQLIQRFEKQQSYENYFSADSQFLCRRNESGSEVIKATTGEAICQLSSYAPPQFFPDRNDLVDYGYQSDGNKAYNFYDGANGRSKGEVRLVSKNLPYAYDFKISPDGRFILARYEDNILRAWNVSTGDLVRTLAGHTKRVANYCYSPCGTKLATTSDDGTIRLWYMTSPKPVLNKKVDSLGILVQATESEKGRSAVWMKSTRNDGMLQQIVRTDDETGDVLSKWVRDDSSIEAVAVSDDQSWLACYSSAKKTIRVLKLEDGSQVKEFPWPEESVTVLALSQNGTLLSAAGGTKIEYGEKKDCRSLIITWDLSTGMETQRYKNTVYGDTFAAERFRAAAIPPSQQYLAVLTQASFNGELKIIDLKDGGSIRAIECRRTSVRGGQEQGFVKFDRESKLVIVGGEDNFAQVFDLKSGNLLFELSGEIHEITTACFSPTGERIATGDRSGRLKIWETSTGNELFQIQGHTEDIQSLQWPEENLLMSQGRGYDVIYWNADLSSLIQKVAQENVREIKTIANSDVKVFQGFDPFLHLIDAKTDAEFGKISISQENSNLLKPSPQGENFLTAGKDGVIRVWNCRSGDLIRQLTGHVGEVKSCRFALEGSRLISWGEDKTARLWDLLSGTQIGVLTEKWTDKSRFALDGDEKLIVLFDQSPKLKVFDLTTGKVRYQWDWGSVDAEVHIPEDTQHVVVTNTTSTKMWSLVDGEMLLDTPQNYWNYGGNGVTFSTDGRFGLKRAPAGDVLVLDTKTNASLFSIAGATDLSEVEFSHDSNYLCVGNQKSFEVWDIAAKERAIKLDKETTEKRFSPGDRYFVAIEKQTNSLHVWDLASRNEVLLKENTKEILEVDFSKDLKKLYAFGVYGLSIWNLDTASLDCSVNTPLTIRTIFPSEARDQVLCLMTGSWNQNVLAWVDTKSSELTGLKEIESWVSDAKFSEDAKLVTITTYSSDGDRGYRKLRSEDFVKESDARYQEILKRAGEESMPEFVVRLEDATEVKFDRNGVSKDGRWTLFVTEDYSQSRREFRLRESPVTAENVEQQNKAMLEKSERQWRLTTADQLNGKGNFWPEMFHLAWLLKQDPDLGEYWDRLQGSYKNWRAKNTPRQRGDNAVSETAISEEIEKDARLPQIVREMLLIPRGNKLAESEDADGNSRSDRGNLQNANFQINERIWKKVARPLAEGVTISEEEIAEMRRVVAEEPTSAFVNTLAAAELRAGNLDKAIEACRRSIALVTKGKENGLSYSSDYAMLTLIYHKNENREEAEKNNALFEKAFANEKAGQSQQTITADDHSFAVEVKTALLGSDHLETLVAERDFGLALTKNNEYELAQKTLSAVVLRLEKKQGRQAKDTQMAVGYLGFCLRSMDRDAEAIPLLEEAYRFGQDDEAFSWISSNVRYAYVRAKKRTEYDRWVTAEYLPKLRKSSAENAVALANGLQEVGDDYYQLEDFEKSEKLLLEASEIAEKNDPAGLTEVKIRSLLGKVYISAKKYAEAQRQLEKVHMSLMEYEWANPFERSELMLENLDRLILLYHERMDAAGESKYQALKRSYEEKKSAR